MQREASKPDIKLGIMQPYFFPYIGYFQLIKAVDTFILYDKVQYIKKGWINRNRIVEVNRADRIISVPVKHIAITQLIAETEIDNSVKWQHQMIKIIEFNYKRSPFFDEIFTFIKPLLSIPYQQISQLNSYTIQAIASFLDIKTNIITEDKRLDSVENDLSGIESDENRKTRRVLSICKKFNAKAYVNPIGGVDLYSKSNFKVSDIDLFFVKTKAYHYQQFGETFIPHLSIIDVLFCCGLEKTKELLNNYELI